MGHNDLGKEGTHAHPPLFLASQTTFSDEDLVWILGDLNIFYMVFLFKIYNRPSSRLRVLVYIFGGSHILFFCYSCCRMYYNEVYSLERKTPAGNLLLLANFLFGKHGRGFPQRSPQNTSLKGLVCFLGAPHAVYKVALINGIDKIH